MQNQISLSLNCICLHQFVSFIPIEKKFAPATVIPLIKIIIFDNYIHFRQSRISTKERKLLKTMDHCFSIHPRMTDNNVFGNNTGSNANAR